PYSVQADRRVTEALKLIDARLADQRLTVASLARELGISPRRLRQLFLTELGIPPKAYICEQRLAKARALLETSSLRVKEIMGAIGFNDPSDFSKQYKALFGAAPRKWRERFYSKRDAPGSPPN
ncbi:MAG: helix-turn-helix domain-containing protein, partial [Terriglobia bacterium]